MLTKNHADDNLSRNRHVRDPEMCVDYLSYRFDEMDLAASWRVMTKQKKQVVNGIRLENASWRTWAKHKYNLKTVSPETLNWLKDSDVTWLYGPLHTVIKNIDEEDRYAKPKISKTEDTLGLMTRANGQTPSPRPEPPLKSALKKVTTSDLLRRSAIELPNLVNDTPAAKASAPKAATMMEEEEEESSTATTTPSSSSNMSLTEANKKLKVFSPSIVATHRQPKLRFNQYVEQCVALSTGEASSSSSSSIIQKNGRRARFENMDDDDNDHHDDDDQSILYTEDEDDNNNILRSSIKKIAPTRLKTSSQSEQETDDVSSLSSSSSSFRTDHNRRWTIEHAHDDNDSDGSSSSENEEIEIRSRQHYSSTSPPQAIQWVGQSCVYNHQPPMDYDEEDDYGFDDDDDWDTHDEEDNNQVATTSTVNHHLLSPPRQQVGKALPVSEPCTIDATEPSISRSTTQHSSTVVDMHRNMDTSTNITSSSSSSSSNIFSNFTQWASSYLWSKPSSSSRPS
ncbi:hypothetical protein K492DRAFT_237773 [Lichtheimia hyalospora FSU 10163]|nr:hypothetical protein K492DRAFT_237773 [Lichtheimia hyalospora FSU 10163]